MTKQPALRLSTLLSIFIAVVLFCVGAFLWQVAVERAIERKAERQSFAWAELASKSFPRLELLATGAELTSNEIETVERLQKFGDIFRFKLFSPSGELRFASDEVGEDNGGLRAHNASAASVIDTLEPYTITADGTQKPNRPDYYSETYLPVVVDGSIVAVLEVYVDQTANRTALQRDLSVFGIAVLALAILALLMPCSAYLRALANLKVKNTELEAERANAQVANRAKSDFLATMSHEIRTPMNGVLGMANLLAKTELGERQRMLNDVILQSGEQLLHVINEILDFSKVDAGELTLDPKPFKLSRVINEPVRMLSKSAEEKQLPIIVRIQPDLPNHVVGDFNRLNQIVTNLVSNAVKFTESGEVFVNVVRKPMAHSTPSNISLRVEISDTGCGIPDDHLLQIFDKFSQVDSSSTRAFEGTGLGLAITKGLVDLMGGTIGVESAQGEGSTFWVEIDLPVADSAPVAAVAPVSAAGKKVLSVDDNENNRYIVRELLQAWGMEEASASSGREALQLLSLAQEQGRPFEAVIMDHHMPGMDGMQTLSAIRSDPKLAHLPVVLLSSISPSDAKEVEHSLADSHVLKPAPVSDLFDALMNAMSASSLRMDLQTQQQSPADQEGTSHDTSAVHGTVLLVEDNHVNRLVVKQILAEVPVRIIEAHNGAEALDLTAKHRPDVILMDISMPVMNGLEATRRIRERERTRNLERVPILGVTAHAMGGDRAKCIEAGMDSYLAKPIDESKLIGFVTEAIYGQSDVRAS